MCVMSRIHKPTSGRYVKVSIRNAAETFTKMTNSRTDLGCRRKRDILRILVLFRDADLRRPIK